MDKSRPLMNPVSAAKTMGGSPIMPARESLELSE